MALTDNERRSLLNMGGAGFTGPYPSPDVSFNNIPDLRHLLGLYRFVDSNPIAELSGIAKDGDILLEYFPQGEGTVISLSNGDLTRDQGFKTAVLISLLTDKLADLTDIIPDNSGERRGWWADPDLGSKLWLLFRSSLTPDLPSRIETASEEALQWMIDEGVASDVIVNAERTDLYTITWTIQIIKPGEVSNSNFKFFFNWENELFGEL